MTVKLRSFGVEVLASFENRRLGPAAFDTKEEALAKVSSMGLRWGVRQFGQKFYICRWWDCQSGPTPDSAERRVTP